MNMPIIGLLPNACFASRQDCRGGDILPHCIVYRHEIQFGMIKFFVHKGLEKFFLTGSKAGIQAAHADKLARQLAILNVATAPDAMDQPGWKLHGLMGNRAGHWSVWVNGNWGLTFKFSGEDAEVVDYQDYH